MRNPFLWAQEIQTPFLPLQRHGRLRLFQVLSANITYHHFSLSVAKLRWSVVFFLRLLTGGLEHFHPTGLPSSLFHGAQAHAVGKTTSLSLFSLIICISFNKICACLTPLCLLLLRDPELIHRATSVSILLMFNLSENRNTAGPCFLWTPCPVHGVLF